MTATGIAFRCSGTLWPADSRKPTTRIDPQSAICSQPKARCCARSSDSCMAGVIMLALVNASLLHGLIALLGFLLIAEGLGPVIAPSARGFLAGPGATRPSARRVCTVQLQCFIIDRVR